MKDEMKDEFKDERRIKRRRKSEQIASMATIGKKNQERGIESMAGEG